MAPSQNMSAKDPTNKMNEMEEGLVKEQKESAEATSTNIRINPFAVREGKKLSWTDVNMTVVSSLL
jgi:hypothetical protein